MNEDPTFNVSHSNISGQDISSIRDIHLSDQIYLVEPIQGLFLFLRNSAIPILSTH